MSRALQDLLGAIWTETQLLRDFEALCDCGGRLAGSDSEFAARSYLNGQLTEIGELRRDFTFEYTGHSPLSAAVTLRDRALECTPLPGSPSTPAGGLTTTVVDLGLGTERDFAAAGQRLRDRIVLVRHEYPFTTGHTHRWRKYQLSRQYGAAAMLIANNTGSGPVSGGIGTGAADDIPAAGISLAAGELLARSPETPIHVEVCSKQRSWQAANLILDLPGETDELVVVCAHYDGHHLAESAMDNATGAAAALELGRRFAPLAPELRRGIRLALFTLEEWGLTGSRRYLEQLTPADRDTISAAIALDSITGHPRLGALTSESERMERLVRSVTKRTGVPFDTVRPALPNSDHHNFYLAGIPALRIVAGYGRSEALSRYLLTPADTRETVDPAQLKAAVASTALLLHAACTE